MKQLYLITLIFLFSSNLTLEAESPSKIISNSLLFVLSAEKASIYVEEGETFLRLSHVRSKVLYFADQPSRSAGYIKTSLFFEYWDKGNNNFATIPPNAAITGSEQNFYMHRSDKPTAVVTLLEKPMLLDKETCIFKIKILNSIGSREQTFSSPKLFIDNLRLQVMP